MSKLTIEERFELPSSPERTWAFLLDPERVVVCLPGASLDEQTGENAWKGTMKVSVGPVSLVYEGTAEFDEVDEEERRIRLVGTGREASGSGTARMTMTSRVAAMDGGGSEVSVEADVDVSGKMVRFGRGMIERVSRELFKEFTVCVRERMAEDEEAAGADDVGGGEDAGAAGEAESAQRAEEAENVEKAERAEEAEEGVPRGGGRRGESGDGSGEDSLKALPLLLRTLRSWIRELLGLERR